MGPPQRTSGKREVFRSTATTWMMLNWFSRLSGSQARSEVPQGMGSQVEAASDGDAGARSRTSAARKGLRTAIEAVLRIVFALKSFAAHELPGSRCRRRRDRPADSSIRIGARILA